MDRSQYVGSSEVAALFGLSPWLSEWELWMIKAGRIPARDLSGEERVQAGLALEASIADWAAQKFGWVTEAGRFCASDDTPGMGATPDYIIVQGEEEELPLILEVKNIGLDTWARWKGEVPFHYILQVQHQMACAKMAGAYIVALVGGNELHPFRIKRSEKIIQEIKKRVSEFWDSIREGREPPFTGYENEIRILHSLNDMASESLDLSTNNAFIDACHTYLRTKAKIDELEKELNKAKATILHEMMGAKRAQGGGFEVSISITPERPPRPPKPGEMIPGRAESRRLIVKEKKNV